MGTIQFIGDEGLYEHEACVGQVWDDGTVHGGGEVCEVERRTVGWRALCECGWVGERFVQRSTGEDAWVEWEHVPQIESEWRRHLQPFIDALTPPVVASVQHPLRWVRLASSNRGIVATCLHCDGTRTFGGDVYLDEVVSAMTDHVLRNHGATVAA